MKNKLLIFLLSIVFVCLFNSCGEYGTSNTEINLNDYAIAYNVLVDGEKDNYEVFTMNFDGSDKNNITNLPGVEWTYLSVKDKLYFISDKDTCQRCNYFLYETNYKGENLKKISEIPLADSWMSSRKNGTELIVDPHPSVDSAFYIIDLNGNVLQRIETGLPYAHDPLFVNNGEQIAFRGANKKSKREAGFFDEIYIINTDGTGLKQLTHYPKSDTTAPWYAYKAGPPKLHPTENFISYASFQNEKYSLFGVSVDGEKQWKLTSNKQTEVYHDWSPDGKWLVTDISDANELRYDIALINWRTKEIKILTDTTYQYQQSPNFVLKD